MSNISGADRILYIKWQGNWLPIACLKDNSFSEISEVLPTTTRDNDGWATSRPTNQSYTINFDGLQVNSTVAGGNFNVASYDRLKIIKRNRMLIDWKIQGVEFPIVDYGKGYITEISEASPVDDFLSFSGVIIGYGIALTTTLGEFVLNDGDPNSIITTNEDANFIIKTKNGN
jgi:hypothetical protein